MGRYYARLSRPRIDKRTSATTEPWEDFERHGRTQAKKNPPTKRTTDAGNTREDAGPTFHFATAVAAQRWAIALLVRTAEPASRIGTQCDFDLIGGSPGS